MTARAKQLVDGLIHSTRRVLVKEKERKEKVKERKEKERKEKAAKAKDKKVMAKEISPQERAGRAAMAKEMPGIAQTVGSRVIGDQEDGAREPRPRGGQIHGPNRKVRKGTNPDGPLHLPT